MRVVARKVSLGLVIGSRAFFSPCAMSWTRAIRPSRNSRPWASTSSRCRSRATENGAVQSIADAKLYAEHFKKHRDEIDGLVICLPNFGDENRGCRTGQPRQARRSDPAAGLKRRTRQGRRQIPPRRVSAASSRLPTISGSTVCPSPRPPNTPWTSIPLLSGTISTGSRGPAGL